MRDSELWEFRRGKTDWIIMSTRPRLVRRKSAARRRVCSGCICSPSIRLYNTGQFRRIEKQPKYGKQGVDRDSLPSLQLQPEAWRSLLSELVMKGWRVIGNVL